MRIELPRLAPVILFLFVGSLGSASPAENAPAAADPAVLDGRPRPKYAWKKNPDGSLEVTVDETPREVNVWQGTNPAARDFRLDVIGKT
jgi:hypothetical protein